MKKGSALILVFSVVAVIGIITTILVRSTMLYYNFAVDRLQHVRQQLALQALRDYVIAKAEKEAFSEPSWHKSFENWPDKKSSFQADLSAKIGDKKVYATAHLKRDDGTLLSTIIMDIKIENGIASVLSQQFK